MLELIALILKKPNYSGLKYSFISLHWIQFLFSLQ